MQKHYLFAADIEKDTDSFELHKSKFRWHGQGTKIKFFVSCPWQLDLHDPKLQEKKQQRQSGLPSLNKVKNLFAVDTGKKIVIVMVLSSIFEMHGGCWELRSTATSLGWYDSFFSRWNTFPTVFGWNAVTPGVLTQATTTRNNHASALQTVSTRFEASRKMFIYQTTGHASVIYNGLYEELWLKHKSLYGDQELTLNSLSLIVVSCLLL